MEVFAGLSRGANLVCIGWATLVATDQVAAVGQVFILAMLAGLLGGPLLGVIADRQNRRNVAVAAHLGIALVMLGMSALIASGATAKALFLVTAFAVQLLRLLYQLAHDGLVKANVADGLLLRTIGRLRATHLLATSVGTLATGILIAEFGPWAGFAGSALMSLFVVPVVLPIKGSAVGAPKRHLAFLSDLRAGARTFATIPALRPYAVVAIIALPLGQLSNAVLSGLVRDDLGHGSDIFGLVDSAWPIGGLAAALFMSLGLGLSARPQAAFVFAAIAGTSTIWLGLSTSIPLLVLAHGAMGFSVWMGHIAVDAKVLSLAEPDNVGRLKSYIHVLFSGAAIVMCLSPSVFSGLEPRTYFLAWGGIALIGSLGSLMFLHLRRQFHTEIPCVPLDPGN